MAKSRSKSSKAKAKARSTAVRRQSDDDRPDSLTLAWTSTLMACILCELAWGITRWLKSSSPENGPLGILLGSLTLAVVAVGLLCLLLTAAVHLSPSPKPPRVVTLVAIALGGVPLVILLANFLST